MLLFRALIISLILIILKISTASTAGPYDTLIIAGQKYAIEEINHEVLSHITYEQLVNLPFESLVKISGILEISIDELLRMKTAVSSKAASTIREQPNILTVITDEQIKKSGFHDLMSVLQIVPGTFFGSDVSGVFGLGMRGIWSQEGKILLLLDGHEINEPRYAGLPFLNHIDIEQVKRIEVIRGSGSSVWGGSAELGVINIITKKGSEINGIEVSTTGSYLTDAFGRKKMSIAAGKSFKNIEFSLLANIGRAHKSDREYKSFYFVDDNSDAGLMQYNLAGKYGVSDSRSINAALSWKNFSTRFIYDYYKTYGIDYEIYDVSFETFSGEVKYDWIIIPDKLQLQPKLNLRYSIPWYTEGWYENQMILRQRMGLSLLYCPLQIFTITGGVEYFGDMIYYENSDMLFYNNKDKVTYDNYAIFLELVTNVKQLKIITGGRLENNNLYGFAFAPRVGFNQVMGNFHYKVLFSKAYRAPGIGNLEKNQNLEPEKTYVLELESGYRIRNHMFLTANCFDVRIKDPIYYLQGDTFWDYRNGDLLGSRGVELEVSVRHPRISASVSYSFYQAYKRGTVDTYKSSIENDAYLGAPQHKVGCMGFYNITEKLALTSSMSVYSRIYGYLKRKIISEGSDELDNSWILPLEGSMDPTIQINCGISTNDLWIRNLQINVGVNDILNKARPLLQPYNGYEAPMPGQGREIYCNLNYHFKFKKRNE